MMGLMISFVIAILLEIILPIALAFYAVKRLKVGWVIISLGALIFFVVQTVQIPIMQVLTRLVENNLQIDLNLTKQSIVDGLILGVSAGVLAELARWGAIKTIKQIPRDMANAIGLGIGFGLVETILLVGLPVVVSFVTMMVYKNASLSDASLPEGLATQVQALWQLPWYTPILGAIERVASLFTHITLSVMVMQVFLRGKTTWLFYAIGWHVLLESLPIMMGTLEVNVWLIEIIITIFSAINIYFMMRLGVFNLIRDGIGEEQTLSLEGA